MAKQLRTSGNTYIEPLIDHFNTKIEEVEQAYIGVTDTNGNPISEYIVRAIKELAVKIRIDLEGEK